jgi:hypothetical protein
VFDHTHFIPYMNIINKRAENELELTVNIFLRERLGSRLRDDESLGLGTDGALCWVHYHCSMARPKFTNRR